MFVFVNERNNWILYRGFLAVNGPCVQVVLIFSMIIRTMLLEYLTQWRSMPANLSKIRPNYLEVIAVRLSHTQQLLSYKYVTVSVLPSLLPPPSRNP